MCFPKPKIIKAPPPPKTGMDAPEIEEDVDPLEAALGSKSQGLNRLRIERSSPQAGLNPSGAGLQTGG